MCHLLSHTRIWYFQSFGSSAFSSSPEVKGLQSTSWHFVATFSRICKNKQLFLESRQLCDVTQFFMDSFLCSHSFVFLQNIITLDLTEFVFWIETLRGSIIMHSHNETASTLICTTEICYYFTVQLCSTCILVHYNIPGLQLWLGFSLLFKKNTSFSEAL